MNLRRLAREYAFLCLMQLSEPVTALPEPLTLLRSTAELLRGECELALQQATAELQQTHEQLILSDVETTKDIQQARLRLQKVVDLSQQAINQVASILDIPVRVALLDHPEIQAFAQELVAAFQKLAPQVDAVIQENMVGWQLERLGKVEQGILRLCVTEFLAFPNTSIRISISEAVELAKGYGSESSSSFVNGVLRRIYEALHATQTETAR